MSKGKVTKVVDGDTFIIKGGRYIRLEGVDTPEKGTKGFASARKDLEGLIESKTVLYDEVGRSYGRIVAKVRLGGKSVNGAMKRKGYSA